MLKGNGPQLNKLKGNYNRLPFKGAYRIIFMGTFFPIPNVTGILESTI